MTSKLNQIIAVEKGVKSRTQKEFAEAHHALQKQALLNGISRSYKPNDELGETFPSETTRVQIRAKDMLLKAQELLTELIDITASKDEANTYARANLVVDGQKLLTEVPVTSLLFLEKQLVDIHTFIKKLPVLDPSETWNYDTAADCYCTPPSLTVKTKKVPRNHVKAEATDKHPAQVEMYYEDIKVGEWKTVKFSGACPQSQVNQLLDRVEKLQKAIKFAREEANNSPVKQVNIGKSIFEFLFAPTK
jgi:hypothetical protein